MAKNIFENDENTNDIFDSGSNEFEGYGGWEDNVGNQPNNQGMMPNQGYPDAQDGFTPLPTGKMKPKKAKKEKAPKPPKEPKLSRKEKKMMAQQQQYGQGFAPQQDYPSNEYGGQGYQEPVNNDMSYPQDSYGAGTGYNQPQEDYGGQGYVVPPMTNQKGKKQKASKQPKQPKQPKPPKQPVYDANGNLVQKKGLPVFVKILIVIGIIFLILALVVVGFRIKNSLKKPTPVDNPPIEVTVPEEPTNTPNNTGEVVENPPAEQTGEVVDTPEVVDNPIEGEDPTEFAYSNQFLGVKFNYDNAFDGKTDVANIQNTLRNIELEDVRGFNIYKDVVPEEIKLIDLDSAFYENIYGYVTIKSGMAVETIEKEDEKGKKYKEDMLVPAFNVEEDDLVENLDASMVSALEQAGAEVLYYGDTTIQKIGYNEDLDGIFMETTYTMDGQTVDSVSCFIPVGRNVITVHVYTHGNAIDIDKKDVLNSILDSLVIEGEAPENIEDLYMPITEE